MELFKFEEEKFGKKGIILNAALDIFAEKGFFSTRPKDIAKHAKISVGTIYNYFVSKEDLFASLIKEIIKYREKMGDSILKKDIEPKDKIKRFIFDSIYFIINNPKVIIIVSKEVRAIQTFRPKLYKELYMSFYSLTEKLINSCEKGGLVFDDSKYSAFLLVVLMEKVIDNEVEKVTIENYKKISEKIYSHFMYGINKGDNYDNE